MRLAREPWACLPAWRLCVVLSCVSRLINLILMQQAEVVAAAFASVVAVAGAIEKRFALNILLCLD